MKAIRVASFCVLLAICTFASAQNPVPFLNQALRPTSAAPGGPTFTLTVNGTAFISGATINWNGVALTTSFVSVVELTATVPAANIAKAGTASVTVTNPAPGGGTSSVEFFSITNETSGVPLTEIDSRTGLVPDIGTGVISGDFNGDGKLDLAIPSGPLSLGVSPGICVLLGLGDGSFQPPKCSGGVGVSDGLDFEVTGDFNQDGKLDIAAASNTSGHVEILLGNGDGTFQPEIDLGIPVQTFVGLSAGDFNRDGKLDLAVFQFDPTEPLATFSIYPGNGDGTFGTPLVTTSQQASGPVTIGDFNDDGKLDLAGSYFTLLGNGDGTFQLPQVFSFIQASLIFAADMNGDGKLDLIVIPTSGAKSVSILLGNGDGTFQNAIASSTAEDVNSAVVGDLNGDGKLDLAVLSLATNPPTLAILLGNGDGTFGSPVTQSVEQAGQPIQIGDFNDDGRMDIVSRGTGTGSNDLGVLLQGLFPAANLGSYSLTFQPQATGTTSPAQVITLTNSGGLPMTISGISITGSDAGDFAQTNSCGSSLAVGASCNVSVTFTPSAVGTRSAAVNFADNAPGSPQTIALTGTVEDFTVTANPPTSQTVTPGQAANYTITVSPSEGFEQTIAFTCSGTPAGSTCTFTPSSVTLDGTNPTTVSVAIVTKAGTISRANPGSRNSGILFASFVGLFGIALVVSPRGKRRGRFYSLAFLCLLAIGTMPACGGGGSTTSGSGGTPLGTDTIKVTGTYTAGSSTLSHSADLALVVQ